MIKNSQEKIPYLSDGELYSIWKYLNGFRLVNRSRVLNFDDLTASGENRLFIAKFLSILKSIGVGNLKDLIFHKDIYLQYGKKRYEELKKEKERGSLNGFALKHLEFLEKIFNDPTTLYENDYGIYAFVFYEGKLGCLEFFEFSANLPPKDKLKLDNFIQSYTESFINDTLQKDKVNFYCFNKQKRQLFGELFYKEKDYGRSFIYEYPKKSDSFFGTDKEYLFIHTLISLEILGYFEVESIWIFDMVLSPEEQTENYKVKINLNDKFFDESEKIMYGIKPLIVTTQKIESQKKSLDFNDKEKIGTIKENLERRFNALLKFKDFEHYISLELDYINFIGNNEMLGKIIESLVLENKINRDVMRNLCTSYSVVNSDNQNENRKLPTFLTKKVDEKLELREYILSLLKEMWEEDKNLKKAGLSHFDRIKEMGDRSEQDIFDMQKLHNDIMEKLTFFPTATSSRTGASFDKNSSILKFNNKDIIISKSKNTNPHYLLTTIFKNKKKVWNYDEIADDLGNDYDKNSWLKYYNAGYKVNEKIAKETTIKDFLIITSKTVSINKKYI